MYSNLFSPDSIAELTVAMQTQFPKAIWETFYVTFRRRWPSSLAFRWACCS